jgi:hypothetical protein
MRHGQQYATWASIKPSQAPFDADKARRELLSSHSIVAGQSACCIAALHNQPLQQSIRHRAESTSYLSVACGDITLTSPGAARSPRANWVVHRGGRVTVGSYCLGRAKLGNEPFGLLIVDQTSSCTLQKTSLMCRKKASRCLCAELMDGLKKGGREN